MSMRIFRLLVVGCLMISGAYGEFRQFAVQIVGGSSIDEPISYVSRLHLTNLSPTDSVRVEVRLFQNDGSQMWRLFPDRPPGGGVPLRTITLPPLGARTLRTSFGAPVEVGWALIESDGPVGVVGTLELHEIPGGTGSLLTSTSIPVEPTATSFSSYALHFPTRRTGFAVLNTSREEAAEVTFRLYTSSEGSLVGERTIVLPPRQKIAQFLNENELFTDLEIFAGSVEIFGTQPLAAVVILQDGPHWSHFRLFPGRFP